MNLGAKLLIALLFAGGGYRVWQQHEHDVTARELAAVADSNGFVPIAMPDGAPQDTVVIFAALNCPSAQARRADALAEQLKKMGIPFRRTNNYSISRVTPEQISLLPHTNAVMGGEIPIVLLNGMARNNPSVDEVALEYHRDR